MSHRGVCHLVVSATTLLGMSASVVESFTSKMMKIARPATSSTQGGGLSFVLHHASMLPSFSSSTTASGKVSLESTLTATGQARLNMNTQLTCTSVLAVLGDCARANHKSVLGVGAYAQDKGALLSCADEPDIQEWLDSPPEGLLDHVDNQAGSHHKSKHKGHKHQGHRHKNNGTAVPTYSLLAYPAKDNYEGVLYPLDWVHKVRWGCMVQWCVSAQLQPQADLWSLLCCIKMPAQGCTSITRAANNNH